MDKWQQWIIDAREKNCPPTQIEEGLYDNITNNLAQSQSQCHFSNECRFSYLKKSQYCFIITLTCLLGLVPSKACLDFYHHSLLRKDNTMYNNTSNPNPSPTPDPPTQPPSNPPTQLPPPPSTMVKQGGDKK
jgi:hypothetical protein